MAMTSMSDQVEEAEKRNDEIWNQMYGEKNPPEDEKGKTGEPAPKKKEDEPKPDDKPKEEPKPDDKPKEDTVEYWKHKYEVESGRLRAQVPQIAFELAESKKETERLQKELDEAKKPKEEPKKEPEPKKEEDSTLKKFKDEYPEIYEGSTHLVRELIKENLPKPNNKIDDLEKRVGKTEEGIGDVKKENALSAKEKYLSAMDSDPDVGKEWRTINEDDDFMAALEEIEPLSGAKKMDLLKSAWNSMDPVRTLRFFKDFKASKKPDPSEQKKEEPKKEDTDVHPPRGKKADETKKESSDIITPETIIKFYKDVADGKYKGKEAEQEKEEQRIHGALFKKKQP